MTLKFNELMEAITFAGSGVLLGLALTQDNIWYIKLEGFIWSLLSFYSLYRKLKKW